MGYYKLLNVMNIRHKGLDRIVEDTASMKPFVPHAHNCYAVDIDSSNYLLFLGMAGMPSKVYQPFVLPQGTQ